MAARFEIYVDKSGKHRIRLVAANGQIIASGQGYSSKAAAMNGIESIKNNASSASVEDLT